MNEPMDNLLQRWASIGAGFNIEPANEEIDLERLLLDTARHTPENARLFIMAATWLHTYGDMIAKHRLKRLIHDELEAETQPILGLLLDTAQQGTYPLEFETVIKQLKPAAKPKPLFISTHRNPRLAQLAKRKASKLSERWNLWCQPIEFKHDAIRPASWIIQRHPQFRTRADFRGDLRASILAALSHDAGAGDSELKLAQLSGGSRTQVRNALANLQMTGRITTHPAAGANRREVRLLPAA